MKGIWKIDMLLLYAERKKYALVVDNQCKINELILRNVGGEK
jgi:hypothetical protein